MSVTSEPAAEHMGDFLQGCDVLGRGWVSVGVGVGGDSPHPQVFGQFSERKAGDGARQAVLFENIIYNSD